ncbi:MAG: hypothetical protein K6F35_05165 [Lachnospiraceae bacterium]|nr:hypothetical protein [Lachnospiraceae bacterium]
MAAGKKILYFILLGLAALLLIINGRKDREAEIILGIHESDDASEMQTEDFALWPGDYQIRLSYQAEEVQSITFCTDYAEGRYPGELDPGEKDFEFPVHIDSYTDILHLSYPIEQKDSLRMKSLTVRSEHLLYTDSVFEAAAVLFMGILLFFFVRGKWFQSRTFWGKISIAAMAGAVILASLPLFTGKAYEEYDVWAHFLRLEGVLRGLMHRQFPVMIYGDSCNGFGVLGAMYPNAPLYFPALLRLLRVSAPAAMSCALILTNILTVLLAFISGIILFDRDTCTAAWFSCFYVLSPYRMVDLYTRYAIGEVMAMAFIPLLIAGISCLVREDGRENNAVICLAAGMTGVIHTHILSILLSVSFLILLCIMNGRVLLKKNSLITILKAAGWSVAINIGFLVPFVAFYLGGINSEAQETQDFATDMTMLTMFRNYTGGFPVGLVGMIGALTVILGIVFLIRRPKKEDRFFAGIFLLAILHSFLSSRNFPWDTLRQTGWIKKVTGMIQFPYRFMTIGSCLYALALAFFLWRLFAQKRNAAALLALAVAVLSVFSGILGTFDRGIHYDEMSGGYSRNALEEYYPKGAHEGVYQHPVLFPSSAELMIDEYSKDGTKVQFSYNTTLADEHVDLPLFYYTGYTAWAKDGSGHFHLLPVGLGDEFRVRIGLPLELSGSHVGLEYTGCWYFWLCYALSLAGLALFVRVVLMEKKGKGHA